MERTKDEQRRSNETDQIADNTSAKSEKHSVARTSIQQEEIFNPCFTFTAFRRFARRYCVRQKARLLP